MLPTHLANSAHDSNLSNKNPLVRLIHHWGDLSIVWFGLKVAWDDGGLIWLASWWDLHTMTLMITTNKL